MSKINAYKALEDSGMELMECTDSLVPACCEYGCMVEPDGTCEHGNESVLLELGLI